MRILALVPVKRNMHPTLQLRCFHNVVQMQTYFQGQMDICLDFRGPGDAMVANFRSLDRIANLCAVRQGMVDDYLRSEHTHVLMVDADAEYSSETVASLMRTSKVDLVAPAVLGEGELANTWYDTWGFIDADGCMVRPVPPYFPDRGVVVEMACVGTMYMLPADIFRQGAKYVPVDGVVDHFSLCSFVRKVGRKVLCNTDVVVRHPRLRDFGEKRV